MQIETIAPDVNSNKTQVETIALNLHKDNLRIKNIIIHEIITKRRKTEVTIRERESVIPPGDKEKNFLVSVLDSYLEDANLAYAGFDELKWFPIQLREFLTNPISFLKFSVDAAQKLKKEMEKKPAATGGYLTFIEYYKAEPQKVDQHYLLVILLKDRTGYGISDDLEIQEIQSLDIDNLHFAARIDINRWLSDDEKEKINHVSFLKGKGRGRENVVEYFKLFLGIDENKYSDPARDTLDFVNSIKNFLVDRVSDEDRRGRLIGVHAVAKSCVDNKKAIKKQTIASIVSPDDPKEYSKYLVEQKFEFPDSFIPTENNISRLRKFVIDKENFYLSFNLQAITDGQIRPTTNGHLEILDVPANIIKQIMGSN